MVPGTTFHFPKSLKYAINHLSMKNTHFYKSGLSFSCKRCSACCRYETGFVFLSEEDLKKLCNALKLDRKRLLTVYCRWVTDWKGDEALSLKEKSNKDCILWDNGCTVYNARPFQCVSFPFWESILASKEAWENTGLGCPGIGFGALHSKEAISGFLKFRLEQPVINRKGGEA